MLTLNLIRENREFVVEKLKIKNFDAGEITQKIIEAIDKVYEEDGFTYIFNSADGTGNSIVLKGPENANLTYRILKELGVDIEEEEE